MNSTEIQVNKKRRGDKKRYVSPGACSSSTLFSCCAILAILCLSIQTRLYSDRLFEHKPFISLQPPTLLSKDDGKKIAPPTIHLPNVKEETESNQAASIEFRKSNSQSDLSAKRQPDSQGQQRTYTLQKHRSPPRIVHYDYVYNLNSLEGKNTHIVQSDDSSETKPGTEGQAGPTAKDRGNHQNDETFVNNVADGDDEDRDSAVEDKYAIQNTDEADSNRDGCVAMATWQSSSPVNCNTIHEIDILSSVLNVGKPGWKQHQAKERTRHINITSQIRHEWSRHPSWNESQAKFLGQGWFREAWKLDRQPPKEVSDDDDEEEEGADNVDDSETIILKMLRPERDFTAEFYELHRIDAVAMEQLTHSKFVLDIYGYCGQSALNEFASFRIPELSSLEKFDRQLRGKDSPKINRMKIKLAVSVATGVAHVHELPADIVGDDRPTLAHYDLNPRNVAIVRGGMPKLNDFNVAHLLKYNPKTNLTCGFDSRLHEPWWRAPEEVSLNATPGTLTHAVDIWSLGNLLFHILTTHSPRGKMKDYRMESVRQDVLRGSPPELPKEYLKSKDASVVAFRRAMELCFVRDPGERASAREVANVLFQAYLKIVEAERAKENKKHH